MDINLINILTAFICIIFGYLCGSFSFSIIIGKVFYHQDPRKFGSKNAGGTNAGRLWGKKIGFLVIVLDMIKTIAPMWIAWAILTFVPFGDKPLIASTAVYYTEANKDYIIQWPVYVLVNLGCFLGHCWPCFDHFKGGKGVSAFMGMILGSTWGFGWVPSVIFYFPTLKKCRYVSMGLRVLLTRNDDSYGSGMGPTSNELQRRSYFMGYYGVQSKVIYSNHHNSIGYYSRMGFEMIGSRSLSDIGLYKSIYNDFSSNYPTTESHMRFYTRDYDNDGLYDKSGGQTYNFRTYYAVIGIPEEIFNINNIILYEGCYLSNTDDWRWYWESGNWKKFSEIKIKHYVESIGVTYVEDNGGC